ncbi:MAG: branched-chain amino acid ABC transporter permease [Candidatus Bathyarchaeota archaeon]|nr:branched-chain amino acid ABC transporter permease [Candidatus Bathyarchaeota archaeon]
MIRKNGRVRTKILYLVLMIAFLALLIYITPQKLHVISDGSLMERKTMITVTNVYYFFGLIPLTICYFVVNRMVNSPMGQIFVAIRENEERAKMLGYNVFKYKLISSSISGIFAGLAGALYAPFLLSINPASVLGATVTINVLLYSILGGLGTLIGPMMGAGIITLFTTGLDPYMLGEQLLLALGVFYVLVVLFLPYGIVITWKIKGTSARRTFKRLIESIKISERKEHTTKESTS